MAEWVYVAVLIGTAAVFYRLGQNQAYGRALDAMAVLQHELEVLRELQGDELKHVGTLEARIDGIR